MDEVKRFIDGGGPATDQVLGQWRDVGTRGPLDGLIQATIDGQDLGEDDAAAAMAVLMQGQADELATAAFLAALGAKGITLDELAAMARSMRQFASCIDPDVSGYAGALTDTCGTGGDFRQTFNISTAAAFVLSAADVPVAKHGNRSITSSCGSADVLEALGGVVDLEPAAVQRCIETVGIGFLFAPRFHSSMRHVAGARALLAGHGLRSVFNLLGPLTNPAGTRAQLVGVFDEQLTDMFAEALGRLGCNHALCVHGTYGGVGSGYDELSIEGTTRVSELGGDGSVRTYDVDISLLGLLQPARERLSGGRNPAEGAAILRDVLAARGNHASRAMVILNAGAAIYTGHPAVSSIKDGVALASDILGSGAALEKLDAFIAATQELDT